MNQKTGLVRYLLYFCVQIGEGEFQFKLLNFVNHTAKYGPLNWPIIVHGLTTVRDVMNIIHVQYQMYST